MSTEGELWHIVEAKRDDGAPSMFRIRELDRRPHLDMIFVVEMSYPATDLSPLPNAAAYRRCAELEENWLRPACATLGWEYVASKIEDGSFFLYMYGNGGVDELVSRVSPFDAGLGFYDDPDPEWLEYGALRELLDEAKRLGKMEPASEPAPAKQPSEPAPAKQPSKQPSKQPTKKTSTKRANKTSKTPANKTSKTPANKTSKTRANKTSKTPANKTSKTPANKTSKTPANKTSKTPANKTSKTPANKTSKTPANKTSKTPAKKPAKKPSKKPAKPKRRS